MALHTVYLSQRTRLGGGGSAALIITSTCQLIIGLQEYGSARFINMAQPYFILTTAAHLHLAAKLSTKDAGAGAQQQVLKGAGLTLAMDAVLFSCSGLTIVCFNDNVCSVFSTTIPDDDLAVARGDLNTLAFGRIMLARYLKTAPDMGAGAAAAARRLMRQGARAGMVVAYPFKIRRWHIG